VWATRGGRAHAPERRILAVTPHASSQRRRIARAAARVRRRHPGVKRAGTSYNPWPVAWLAAVVLVPGGILGWIVIGLLAGAIASRLVRGRGLGCLMDLVVGVVGAFIGGFVLSLFVPNTQIYGFIGSLLVAILGAVILLAAVRLIARR
jgi:uncharacterized membrane protein YeaQ/YmgE (transglycosylase-associated protein family)